MKECSKSIARWQRDPNFMARYFKGSGVDIGGRPDPLSLYCELFPLLEDVKVWDREDGDAQHMDTMADRTFDFVFSSHCLEHINNPAEALGNWFRILKPGGHLVVSVPDEDLYEQGVFPSTFNADHSWTFTIWKKQSWSARSINLLELLTTLGGEAEILKVEQVNDAYRFQLPRYDQSRTPVTSCSIEFVVRRRTSRELTYLGRLPESCEVPRLTRLHLNQYKWDKDRVVESNKIRRPFADDGSIEE